MPSKKALCTVSLVLCAALVFSCGQVREAPAAREPESPEASSEAFTEAIESTFPLLSFVDAHGEWHETAIRPDWKKHSYDTEAFLKEEGRMRYESQSDPRTYRLGVDVSKYQGEIDWEKVARDGYEFAIVRVGFRGYGTAGNLKADEYAAANVKNAIAAGLDVGVYFFSQAVNEREAAEEAAFAMSILEEGGIGPDDLAMPFVFDPETIFHDEARTDSVTGEQFTQNAIAFCEAVKAGGYEPMIYCNMMWEAYLLDLGKLEEYPIWYADYEDQPQTPYAFAMWQYSEDSHVDGIEGPADTNLSFE